MSPITETYPFSVFHLMRSKICAPAISGGGAYYCSFYPAIAGKSRVLTLPAPYCRLQC